jgi:dihydroorotase
MLIKNGLIFDEQGSKSCDLLIKDGIIHKIGHNLTSDGELLDADGKYLLPGIVDLNVRVRDDKLNPSNLRSLSQKAIRSGVTTFVLNSYDGLESGTTIDLLKEMLKSLIPDIYLSVSGTNSQNRLNDIAVLINNGAKVIKDHSDIDSNLIRRLMEYATLKNTPMFWFCDDDSINGNASMNEGKLSAKLGLPGNLKIAEMTEVAKVAEFAKFFGAKVLLQTLSAHESIDIAKKTPNENLFVEVAIHNLILDQSSCENFNTYAKLRPPLRCVEQKQKMRHYLQEDKIDTLTSSHSPKSVLFKDVAFEEAMFGVDSLEIVLPLCYTHLVQSGLISMHKLQTLISTNPAKIMGFDDIGKIEEGMRADLILFDPSVSHSVDNRYSPYFDMALFGKVLATIKDGTLC